MMFEILTSIGAASGFFVFCWNVWVYIKSHLQIDLTIDSTDPNAITAKTVVENKGTKAVGIANALLLIGPENESATKTFNQIARQSGEICEVNSTNEIAEPNNRCDTRVYGLDGRSLIPLPFYYDENLKIADERLSYRAPIHTAEVLAGKPYSVRFFVHAPGRFLPRYHRSTHDSFIRPA